MFWVQVNVWNSALVQNQVIMYRYILENELYHGGFLQSSAPTWSYPFIHDWSGITHRGVGRVWISRFLERWFNLCTCCFDLNVKELVFTQSMAFPHHALSGFRTSVEGFNEGHSLFSWGFHGVSDSLYCVFADPKESDTIIPVDMHEGTEVRLGLSKGPVSRSFFWLNTNRGTTSRS